MSIHVHVYLEDIDTQLAVVFSANTSTESSNESALLCSLTRAFVTCIQNINTCAVNPFLHVKCAWNDMPLLKLLFARPFNMQSWTLSWFPYILALRLCSLIVKCLPECWHRTVSLSFIVPVHFFYCHRECHLINQSSQLHSIKELLFHLR